MLGYSIWANSREKQRPYRACFLPQKVAIFNMGANLCWKEKSIPLLFGPKVAIFKLHQFMGKAKAIALLFDPKTEIFKGYSLAFGPNVVIFNIGHFMGKAKAIALLFDPKTTIFNMGQSWEKTLRL